MHLRLVLKYHLLLDLLALEDLTDLVQLDEQLLREHPHGALFNQEGPSVGCARPGTCLSCQAEAWMAGVHLKDLRGLIFAATSVPFRRLFVRLI